ncbi:hypothetical protein JW933_07920 [candidate division FCPU426 bacterium]|nr:hypothetical protein [candidate division FCPU426 bacterium]
MSSFAKIGRYPGKLAPVIIQHAAFGLLAAKKADTHNPKSATFALAT